MNWIEKAQQFIGGSVALTEWLGSGGETVSQEQAQFRANTCLQCPQNNSGLKIKDVIAEAVHRHLELKKHLELRVNGESGLHQCDTCGCVMRLKIWVPFERVAPDEREQKNLDPLCWILKEHAECNNSIQQG